MIRFKVDQLRRKKAAAENRNLPLRTVAEETKLALTTVQQLNSNKTRRVYLNTLDTLCDYFQVTDMNELLERVPNAAHSE